MAQGWRVHAALVEDKAQFPAPMDTEDAPCLQLRAPGLPFAQDLHMVLFPKHVMFKVFRVWPGNVYVRSL